MGLAAADFLRLLVGRSYPTEMIAAIASLPNLEHAALEFCDTATLGGEHVQSAIRGLV